MKSLWLGLVVISFLLVTRYGWAGVPVIVFHEIDRVEEDIRATDNLRLRSALEVYLEMLKREEETYSSGGILYGLYSACFPKKINSEVRAKFIEALERFDFDGFCAKRRICSNRVLPYQLFQVIVAIENLKHQMSGRSHDATKQIQKRLKLDGFATDVVVNFGPDQNVSFSLGEGYAGSFKSVGKWVDYKNWGFFAQKTLVKKDELSLRKIFRNDFQTSRRISQLPYPDQKGLLGLWEGSLSHYWMNQELFDFDLREFIEAHDSALVEVEAYVELNLDSKLDVVEQLSAGLMNLHEKVGLVHGDVKPQNILYRAKSKLFNTSLRRAVYTDFDFSFSPAELMANSEWDEDLPRPIRGTPQYAAPEVRQLSWVGANRQQKIDLAYRMDVFGHAISMGEFLCGGHLYNLTPCYAFPVEKLDFMNCRNTVIERFVRQKQDLAKEDPILNLILKSLNQDPEMRPSSREFYEEVLRLQESGNSSKSGPNFCSNKLSMDSDLDRPNR